MVAQLQQSAVAVDQRLASGSIPLFHGGGRVSTSALDSAASDASAEIDDQLSGEASGDDLSEDDSGTSEDRDMKGALSDDGDDDHVVQAMLPKVTMSARGMVMDAEGRQRRPIGAVQDFFSQTEGKMQPSTGQVGSNCMEPDSDEDGKESNSGESLDSSEGSEGNEEVFAKWRGRMLQRQAGLFSTRNGDLRRLVYAEPAVAKEDDVLMGEELRNDIRADLMGASGSGDDSSDAEDFFTLKSAGHNRSRQRPIGNTSAALGQDINAIDASRIVGDGDGAVLRWLGADSEGALVTLKARFVTGGPAAFEASQARALAGTSECLEARRANENGMDKEEVFGEFEDVEAGIMYSGAPTLTSCMV
jgi:hypothetical protein